MGACTMRKEFGAKLNPEGTPHDRKATSDEYSVILTLKLRFDKYGLNQSRALHLMPTECSK